MMNGAKKGQKPKKPIKQKPVKAFTGLEIAAIGALAGMAGSALMGGGKKAAATPLNNPAAMIAPLSGFVGKEEDKEKAPGMKKGGEAVKRTYRLAKALQVGDRLTEIDINNAQKILKNRDLKGIQDLDDDILKSKMKNMGDIDLSASEGSFAKGGLSGGKRYGAPPKKGPMSQGMKDGGMTYNDKMGIDGGTSKGQYDVQVKKKVFKGIF